MKPRITFQSGSKVIVANSREFSELPPINQEFELRDERYKVVGYESATVILEPVPEQEEAPRARKSPKAKRVAKKQAKVQRKEARAARGKSVKGDGKSEGSKVTGNFYNRKSN